MIWQRSVVAKEEVPSGNFNPGVNFLLKNISDDDVEVTIIPAGQKDSIKTILGVGWNPVIVEEEIIALAVIPTWNRINSGLI